MSNASGEDKPNLRPPLSRVSAHTHPYPLWAILGGVGCGSSLWAREMAWNSVMRFCDTWFLLRCREPVGMKMDLGSPFQPYVSLNCVQWIYLPHNRSLPCSCEVCSPTWGLLSLVYLTMLGKLLTLFGLDSKIPREWQSSLLPHWATILNWVFQLVEKISKAWNPRICLIQKQVNKVYVLIMFSVQG